MYKKEHNTEKYSSWQEILHFTLHNLHEVPLICYSSYIQDHTITILVNKNNTLFTRILNIPKSHFLLKIIYYFEETFSKSVYIFYYIHIGWQNIQNLL